VVVTQEKFRGDSSQRFGQILGSNATYYEWLEVSKTANAEQIRRAYRLKSKLYHPDTTTIHPEAAVQKFRELNEAYAVLSNPQQRMCYDLWLSTTTDSFNASMDKGSISASGRAKAASAAYLGPKERPLSPGELFALFILGLTFVVCLVLALILGIARGEMVLQTTLPIVSERAPIHQLTLHKAGAGVPQKDSAIMEKSKAFLARFRTQG
jgi:DnaJ-domain-containing protein 1